MSISVSEEQQEKNTLELPEYCYSSDFSVISESPAFIDKTLFIKKIFENPSSYSIIIAPPGYGKSTNLDMVKRYVEIDVDPETGKVSTFNHSKNYKIFKKRSLEISAENRIFQLYFAKFPVIYLSLKNTAVKTFKLFLKAYAEKLSQSFQQHRYLMEIGKLTGSEKKQFSTYLNVDKCRKLNASQLECGLVFFAEMLAKHYKPKKVFLLVDDLQYVIAKVVTMGPPEHQESIVKFFNRLFNSTITKSDCPIARSLFVDRTNYFATNITESILLCNFFSAHQYKEFFGLTKNETIKLLIKFNWYSLENFKRIYTLYSFSAYACEQLACTSSVIKYLHTKEIGDFRIQSEICDMNDFLQEWYHFSPARHAIDKLLISSRITMPVYNKGGYGSNVCDDATFNYNLFLTHLMYYGFFNCDKNDDTNSFSIANEMVHRNFKQSIDDYYGHEMNKQLESCAKIFDDISPKSPRHFYYNLIEEFRKTAILYANTWISERNASIQCMADILAKTKFDYDMPVIHDNFPTQLGAIIDHYYDISESSNNSYEPTTTVKKSMFFLRVENETPVEKILAKMFDLHNRMFEIPFLKDALAVVEDKFLIGISTDLKFRFEIGWLFGTDLNQAQYFSFR